MVVNFAPFRKQTRFIDWTDFTTKEQESRPVDREIHRRKLLDQLETIAQQKHRLKR